jgi:sugar phosphate isomerase/epimerase
MKNNINRRKFIGTTCAAASTILFSNAVLKEKKSNYKMGLQLFTIRDAMASDVRGTLKRVSELGYQDLETYGFDPASIGYYGMKATEFKSVLDDLELTTSSGHYDLFRYLNSPDEELRSYVDQCIKGARALNQKYITWPWLNPQDRSIDKFKLLTSKLNTIGEQVSKAGLSFAYHNHDFEFTDHQGVKGYDIIMQGTDPRYVKLQVDLYWTAHSSTLTPEELFRKQPGRFVMWHIKDMHKVSRDYTELGNGSIDYTEILPHAKLAGLEYYFIEQGGNFRKNSMESIAESAAFFTKNLRSYL